MNTFEHQAIKTAKAFSIKGDMSWGQLIILSPIIVPTAIVWGILDFVFGTLPDALLGFEPPSSQPKRTPEEMQLLHQKYLQKQEALKQQRVDEIKADLWPEKYSNR
jgi:hypothetical protein